MKRSHKKTRTVLLAAYLLLALAAVAGARLTSAPSFAMPTGAEKPSFGYQKHTTFHSFAMPQGTEKPSFGYQKHTPFHSFAMPLGSEKPSFGVSR